MRLTLVSSSSVITLPVEFLVQKLCALRCDLLPLEGFDKLLAAPCTGAPVVEEPVFLTTIRKFRIVQTKGKFHQQRLQMEAQQANEQDFDLLATQVEKQHKKQDK